MKKYILSIGMIMAVFAFIAMLPLRASAASSAFDVTENEEGNEAFVKLTLPRASQEGITTVSVSLAVDIEDASVNADNIQPAVDFTEWVEGNTKVHTCRTHEGPVLNIYIAGTTPLFTAAEGIDTLDIGNVYVTNTIDGSHVPFVINVEKSELKVVRGDTAVPVTEEDFLGYGSEPDNPGGSSGNRPDNQPGLTPEIEAIRAELQALIERAETIPAEDRTEDLQRAIDEAKRVLNDPNATSEELQAALTNLENALALFETNQNSGNNSSDTGKDAAAENRQQNGTRIQGVKTQDTNPTAAYAIAAALCMAVLGVNIRCRRRSGRL